MPSKTKISMIQTARNKDERSENIKKVFDYLEEIEGSDIICLPENWCGIEPLKGEEFEDLISKMKGVAKRKDFNILAGALYREEGDKIFDSCYVINKEGEVLGHSDKLFPSEAVGEAEFLSPGQEMEAFPLDGFKIGVVVCVDAAYPEVSRILASQGAKIIFNPSNIPLSRIEMWKHIGASRAVENGVYYIFMNNTSTTYPDGREVSGHSFIASPEGEIIVELDESEQVFHFETDLADVETFRKRWRFLEKAVKENPLDGP